MGLGAAATLGARWRRRGSADRPPWMEQPSPAAQAGKAAILILLAVVMLFPFVYVIAVSFSSAKDVLGGGLILFPAHPTFEAYRSILEGGAVTRALGVSVGITVVGTFVNMVMTVTMAYGLSRPGVPGRRGVLLIVLGTLLFAPGIIPNYLVVKQLGLLDSYAALILPGMISAFNLVVIRSFFMNIPQELLDSARIDGANDARVLWEVVLPLSKAVLAVIALFYGVALWNDYFNALLYLNDTSKWPIQLLLRQFVLQGTASELSLQQAAASGQLPPTQSIQMAVVVIATAPILIVYPFLQKYFTQGVLTGAIKG
jgi:putative aldouronate transport system permease protein